MSLSGHNGQSCQQSEGSSISLLPACCHLMCPTLMLNVLNAKPASILGSWQLSTVPVMWPMLSHRSPPIFNNLKTISFCPSHDNIRITLYYIRQGVKPSPPTEHNIPAPVLHTPLSNRPLSPLCSSFIVPHSHSSLISLPSPPSSVRSFPLTALLSFASS